MDKLTRTLTKRIKSLSDEIMVHGLGTVCDHLCTNGMTIGRAKPYCPEELHAAAELATWRMGEAGAQPVTAAGLAVLVELVREMQKAERSLRLDRVREAPRLIAFLAVVFERVA